VIFCLVLIHNKNLFYKNCLATLRLCFQTRNGQHKGRMGRLLIEFKATAVLLNNPAGNTKAET